MPTALQKQIQISARFQNKGIWLLWGGEKKTYKSDGHSLAIPMKKGLCQAHKLGGHFLELPMTMTQKRMMPSTAGPGIGTYQTTPTRELTPKQACSDGKISSASKTANMVTHTRPKFITLR